MEATGKSETAQKEAEAAILLSMAPYFFWPNTRKARSLFQSGTALDACALPPKEQRKMHPIDRCKKPSSREFYWTPPLFSVFRVRPSSASRVDKLPTAAADVLEQYMDAYKIGTPNAVKYMHFENDIEVNTYRNSGAVLLDYRVMKVEEVNPCLYALKLKMSSSQSVLFGDTWETVYNFLGLIDGKWYYIGNERHIPEDLRANLDPSKYQYDDPNVLIPDEIQAADG